MNYDAAAPLDPTAVFAAYREMRDAALRMLEWTPRGEFDERRLTELAQLDYLFDASPAIVERWREHCHLLSGVQSYAYRAHHAHRARDLTRKLERLKKFDRRDLFVEEPAALGGFGFVVDERRVNVETLRWNESLLALDEAGWLQELEALPRPVTVELGGGWGGFAYALKRRLPNSCHVIIDRPERLLISGTYLRGVFPQATCWIPSEPTADVTAPLTDYDFVLLPDSRWEPYVVRPDLGVSQFTFEQFDASTHAAFCAWLAARGCPRIYHVLPETAQPKLLRGVQKKLEVAYRFSGSKHFRLLGERRRRSRLPAWAQRLKSRLRPSAEPPAKRRAGLQHLFASAMNGDVSAAA